LIKNYISENITHLVGRLKCSQDEFGAVFDLNRGAINSYISKKAQPKIETIQKICEHFKITIDDFINTSLEENKLLILNEDSDIYEIKDKKASEVIELLKNHLISKDKIILTLEDRLNDKEKIIQNLEEKVLYFRTGSDKSAG